VSQAAKDTLQMSWV